MEAEELELLLTGNLLAGVEELPIKRVSCNCRFTTLTALNEHSHTHKKQLTISEKKYKFHQCRRVFTRISLLNKCVKHVHLQLELYKCDLCNEYFGLQSLLCSQLEKHNGVKAHVCEICEKSFCVRSVLQSHYLTHIGDKPYKCLLREKSYAERKALCYHMRNHASKRNFKCQFCNKCFNINVLMQKHMLREHSSGTNNFICDVCDRSYLIQSDITQHKYQVHGSGNLEICTVCSKSFSSKFRLNKHFVFIQKDQPISSTCELKFKYKTNLCRYMSTHLDNKPFKCKHCEKIYSRNMYLEQHIKEKHRKET